MRKKKLPKADFTEKDLPKTRREQFFQIVKDNFSLLVVSGLILLVFLIPFLIAIFIKYSLISSISSDINLSDEARANSLYLTNIIFHAIYIPCFMLLFIPLGGILKIYRRLIWNEPLFRTHDFFLGIKENILGFLLIGFLIGLINFLNMFVYYSLSIKYVYITFIIAGIALAFIIPILFTACYLNTIYMTNIFKNISVAARLFIRRGIFILLLLLPLYAFYFITLLPVYIIVCVLILGISFLFLSPLILLSSYLNSIKNMDDYINIHQYPDKAYLGLYHINESREQQNEEK